MRQQPNTGSARVARRSSHGKVLVTIASVALLARALTYQATTFIAANAAGKAVERRIALRGGAAALLMLLPTVEAPQPAAARGSARQYGGDSSSVKPDASGLGGGGMRDPTQAKKVPSTIDMVRDEGSFTEESWESYDIGESTLVDPKDPKYQKLKAIADIEKQAKKNEEQAAMSPEEKRQKMCDLLGRGCVST